MVLALVGDSTMTRFLGMIFLKGGALGSPAVGIYYRDELIAFNMGGSMGSYQA